MRNCSQKVSTLLCCAAIATMAGAAQESKTETRTEIQTEVRTSKILKSVRYEFSRSVRPGGLVKGQEGKDGEIKRTFRITYSNGKPISKELVEEERTAPLPTTYFISRQGFSVSRGSYDRGRVLRMSASAYTPFPKGGSGRTAMGYRAGYGHVAVDPRVIPMGSIVYVEGYGIALASDKGSAIRGKKIDLCVPNRSTAIRFGRRPVTVHVLRASK
jgi:3D (Asp-Asp-Asp) domain-containing protein